MKTWTKGTKIENLEDARRMARMLGQEVYALREHIDSLLMAEKAEVHQTTVIGCLCGNCQAERIYGRILRGYGASQATAPRPLNAEKELRRLNETAVEIEKAMQFILKMAQPPKVPVSEFIEQCMKAAEERVSFSASVYQGPKRYLPVAGHDYPVEFSFDAAHHGEDESVSRKWMLRMSPQEGTLIKKFIEEEKEYTRAQIAAMNKILDKQEEKQVQQEPVSPELRKSPEPSRKLYNVVVENGRGDQLIRFNGVSEFSLNLREYGPGEYRIFVDEVE